MVNIHQHSQCISQGGSGWMPRKGSSIDYAFFYNSLLCSHVVRQFDATKYRLYFAVQCVWDHEYGK